MFGLKGKSGNPQEVNKDGRALVDAKTEWQQARDRGDAFIWTRETAAFTALDTLLCIRNENSEKDMPKKRICIFTC